MTPTKRERKSPDWLIAGGEMGALIRARDWSGTALGPIEHWPQTLRSAVNMLLASRVQMCLFWGPDRVVFYNDAYRPVFGGKHPSALGLAGREAWSEIWEHQLGPLLQGVVDSGEAFGASDLQFNIQRHGYLEETYFDISYDPVRDESGSVAGVNCIVTETTGRVTGERRLRALSNLGRIDARARTVAAVLERAAEELSKSAEDVAFALLYEWDAQGSIARLRAIAGIDPAHPAAPTQMRAGPEAMWPIAERLPPEGVVVDAASRGIPALPGGSFPEPCLRIAVLPIALPSQPPDAFLVAGLSPRRPYDNAYRDFLRLAAAGIGGALANAKALEDERRRAEALAELDRAKTAFFSNVSHEFRTPLTLLLGPLGDELSKDRVPQASRAQLEVAHRNGLRLLKLVNTLLDFSRLEAGRTRARFAPTDLALATAEIASNFDSACAAAGLSLTVRCDALPEPAFVDRDMWEKVVLNLLSNAFKFTFNGGIEVRLACDGRNAILTVRDSGVGIPPEEVSRLFERFHRVEGAPSRTYEGSGIGLALVQELVRTHGGEIRAESRPGEGSAFHVTLPLGHSHLPPDQIVAAGSAASADQAPAYVQEAMGWLRDSGNRDRLPDVAPNASDTRERVLVADDNADMREYIERLLADSWDVVVVNDGEAALQALTTARFDLVLTDVMMPRMDGFALLRAIRAEPSLRELPVVMVSARAGEEARIEGRDAGANDYLTKPFSAKELIAQVRAQLAIARARRISSRQREMVLAGEREARMDAERQWQDLATLFEQLPNPMVILRGRDNVIELANPAARQAWGRTLEQVLHVPLFDALPEVRGQGLEERLESVHATGQASTGRDWPVRLDRGRGLETVYFDFTYSPLRGASGRVEGVAVCAFEVTDRVTNAADRERREARLPAG